MTKLDFRAPGLPLRLSLLVERAAPGASWDEVWVDGRASRKRDPRIEAGAHVSVEVRDGGRGDSKLRESGDLYLLTVASPWNRGRLALPGSEGREVVFEVTRSAEGLSEIRISLPEVWGREALLRGLALAGFPLLGDARHGGILVSGGLRLHSAPEAVEGWWPEEPVRAGLETRAKQPLSRKISDATGRALRGGHPWARPDSESEVLAGLAPGTWVELEDSRGVAALARVEGPGEIAARVWNAGAKGIGPSVEGRVAAALARRRRLLTGTPGREDTDVCRLIHGEADGLPGLAVDRLGSWLRILWTGRACEGLRDRVVAALQGQLADRLPVGAPVVEVIHLRNPPRGSLESVRLLQGHAEPGRHAVRERGLVLLVDPGLGEPDRPHPGFGVFADQRDNRARMAKRARSGGRFLNLFAHTGAFSVALLAAGADSVVSVDLSAAYLEWLEENLALNQLPSSRHEPVQRDGRRYLESLSDSERFDGIVLDPPTAAAAGRRYWSVRRELGPLIRRSLARLAPGGALLVSRNDLHGVGGTAALLDLVRECADAEGIDLAAVEAAGPGVDFPSAAGFPEGTSFHGCLAIRAVGGLAQEFR